MIRRINGLTLRAFRAFQWPSDLEAFSRFNVIYGWNGSGKTTLSSLLRSVELRSLIPGSAAQLDVDGSSLDVQNLPSTGVPAIRVFNKDFTANAVLRIETELAPIFYFGEESVEKRRRVEQLKHDLKRAHTAVDKARQAATDSERALDRFCVEQAKALKLLLTGAKSPGWCNNYNKTRYRTTAETLTRTPSLQTILDKEGEKRQKGRKDGQPLPAIVAPELATTGRDILGRVETTLRKSLASEGIQELLDDRELSSWLQQGLTLHTGARTAATCRFCAQPLPPSRLVQIETHFNKSFIEFQAEIDSLVGAIDAQLASLSSLALPHAGEVYEDLQTRLNLASSIVKQSITRLATAFHKLRATLLARRDAPFGVPPGGHEPDAKSAQDDLHRAFQEIVTIVAEHNERTARFSNEIEDACVQLERHVVTKRLAELKALKTKEEECASQIATIAEKPEALQREIDRIELEIVEHRRPAEELNRDLRSYLGRDELKLLVNNTGYSLMRGDQPASNLSEGEKTAFALLYFLKSLRDKSFDLTNTVVVIDDPVSSLDANALFSAFSFVKERAQDAGQLIILTHNFAFFRQVRNWFHKLPGQNKKDVESRLGRFYMVLAESIDGLRTARLAPLDPLLQEYESEYHYLFKQVYALATEAQTSTTMERYYGVPNMARRLIEAFLAFRFPQVKGDLWARLSVVDFDQVKKTRILRLLHTYSHAAGVIEPEHDPAVLAETKVVLPELLELIKTTDPGHYAGMLEAIGVPSPETSGQAS